MAKKSSPRAKTSQPARVPTEHWSEEPDEHDYPAAASYLSLICAPTGVKRLVSALKAAPIEHHEAKDLLRASGLALLPLNNFHVAGDLEKIKRGVALSPVLLVRGDLGVDHPLVIADGYHRVCASYHVDENAAIPCHLVDATTASPTTTGPSSGSRGASTVQ